MGESSSPVAPAVPRYDGHYDYWSLLMDNFLKSKEFWYVVKDGIDKEEKDKRGEYATRKLMDLKAKNYLFQAIYRKDLETI